MKTRTNTTALLARVAEAFLSRPSLVQIRSSYFLARHGLSQEPANRLRSRWDSFLLAAPTLDRIE
jgi:hypothetical protein